MDKYSLDFTVFFILLCGCIFIWLLVKLVSFIWNCLFGDAPREQYNIGNMYDIARPRHRKVLAMDTEMVGAGILGSINMLARVSIVDQNGCVYDKYVKPRLPVTDYRTLYSGISPGDLLDAEEYAIVRLEVQWIIEGCILVGHDLRNDLNILCLTHPAADIRDTANCSIFRKILALEAIQDYRRLLRLTELASFEAALRESEGDNNMTTEQVIIEKVIREKPSLKRLAKVILGRDIQVATHDSIEDAQTAFDLFQEFVKRSGFKYE